MEIREGGFWTVVLPRYGMNLCSVMLLDVLFLKKENVFLLFQSCSGIIPAISTPMVSGPILSSIKKKIG